MDKFCTNCGAELNGKSKCDKCGKVNGKAFQNIADKVKNYDYKSKADELKSKAGDIVDKAKNYDYKEKAEEITDNIKNFDYEEKAKQVSDTVKNYDYKGEAENIKNGGIKYFWNKHRKLSIILIIFVIAVVIIPNLGNTKKGSQEVIEYIEDNVTAEKGKKAILGKWKKETGVIYTFEENGHMSVSLSSNYDNSLGTALDGSEVKSILSEIDDFGRVVRGGEWKYIGTQNDTSGSAYVYSLFYQSSQYTCIIPIDDSCKMDIYLSSGIGNISVLTK